MKTCITFGITLNAYVTADDVEIPDDASRDEVIAAIRKYYHAQDEVVFDEDWSSGYDDRMVAAGDPAIMDMIEGVPIDEPQPVFAMKGDGSINDVLNIITHVRNSVSSTDRADLEIAMQKLRAIKATAT